MLNRQGPQRFDTLMPKLPGVPSDQLAVAGLVAVELKAGNCRDHRLQKRLALDERQAGDVATVETQESEREIDEPNPRVSRRSRPSSAKSSANRRRQCRTVHRLNRLGDPI
jgi:hypothetical protein